MVGIFCTGTQRRNRALCYARSTGPVADRQAAARGTPSRFLAPHRATVGQVLERLDMFFIIIFELRDKVIDFRAFPFSSAHAF